MRVLCLTFPQLPVRLAVRSRPSLANRPVILIDGPGDEAIVTAASPEAVTAGVVSGMTAGEARSLCPAAAFLPDNAGECLAELERLASILAIKATDRVAIHARDALIVDASAVMSSFSDERSAARALARLVEPWAECEPRAAIADSAAEAYRLSRGARLGPIVAAASQWPCVQPFPSLNRGEIRVAASLPARSTAVGVRARMDRALARADIVLASRDESVREVTLVLQTAERANEWRHRLLHPLHEIMPIAAGIVPSDADLATASGFEIRLSRLGPAVRTRSVPRPQGEAISRERASSRPQPVLARSA